MPRPDEPVEDDAMTGEEEDGDEEDDAQDGLASDSGCSDGSQTAGTAGKKKKKKKKTKKKKNGSENGTSSSEAAAPTVTKTDKAEADRKFAAALAAIKSDDLWCELSCSNLQDGKVKKLLEQLTKNESLTSLNLSQNSLTDEGAQAIAATLGIGSCVPGLITLDLRENNFTSEGLTILDGLKKVRRKLSIMTGAIIVPVEPAPAAGKSAAAGGDKRLRDLSDSPLVRKYFQIGSEDEDDISMPVASDPSIDPVDLWQQLDGAVSQGTSGIPSQQGLLKQLCQQISSELSSIPDGEYAQNVHRCPHVKACLERLSTLGTILDLTPQPVTVQYHRQPQAAVGSHRVFAAEAVATLVGSQSLAIDQQLVATQLVPRVLHLAISHPVCSAIHARALKLLRAGLGSKAEDLLGAVMVLPGWGLKLQQPADSGAEEGTLCQPFPTFLASRGTAALGVVSGVRNALMGFVIEASKLLSSSVQSAWDPYSDDEPDEELDSASLDPLKRILDANSAWSEFAQSKSGPLSKLSKEQEGDLGGPRAVRVLNHLEGPELAELAGGGMITGQEILALLQGMNMSS